MNGEHVFIDDSGKSNADRFTDAVSKLRGRHPHVQVEVGKTGPKRARLSLIRTAEKDRGKGHAQAAMRDLTGLADKHDVTLHLSPEPLAGDRKTSAARLAEWYETHGFVHNKGRAKDYEISDRMYRPPKRDADHDAAHGRAAMATSTKAPYGDVTYADPGYQADGQKRYPVDTEEHAKAAWSYINQAGNAGKYSSEHLAAIKGKIKAALRKFGVQISEDDSSSSRTESLAPYFRSFPLEDIHVRSSGDGRTVEAYAAVFGTPAEVRDQDGHYTEEIDPAAFNKAISDAAPQGSRRGWKVGVFYNHGMTIHGTPSERHSMPVGVPVEITADSRGLKTVTRYHRGEFCDEILDRIREGSLPGYSFTGTFRRSSPLIPRGGFRQNTRTGELPHVRRTESTLMEYGPTPFPVYAGAAITAMRADSVLGAMAADPELAMRMLAMLRDSTPSEPLPPSGTPDEEQPPRSRLVHSGRPVKQEIAANRSAFLQRQHRR